MREFIPKKSNNNDSTALIALIAASLCMMFASSVDGLPYRSLAQLLTLMLLTLAIALLGRFRFRTYVYSIIVNDEGGQDFCVTEIKKKSRITVCRISLASVEKVLLGTPENKKARKQEAKYRKLFNYCIDLAPKKTVCIFSNEGGEDSYIEVSFCDGLLEALRVDS